MYTLRHPRERAAALHFPPGNAKGLEEGAWAGEEGVLVVVEHDDEAVGDDKEDVEGSGKRRLLAPPIVVKSWCMMVPCCCCACVGCIEWAMGLLKLNPDHSKDRGRLIRQSGTRTTRAREQSRDW